MGLLMVFSHVMFKGCDWLFSNGLSCFLDLWFVYMWLIIDRLGALVCVSWAFKNAKTNLPDKLFENGIWMEYFVRTNV